MKPIARRPALALCACLLTAPLVAVADTYPAKPVRVVVPFLVGGGNDFLGRDMSSVFQTTLGQSFVVENKAGAAGMIGSDFVAKSTPDGYTLLMAANTAAIVDATAARKPFSLESDLTGVGMVASMPMLLVVSKDLGVNTTAELIQLAKAKPGALNYASSGPGSVQHLSGALFASTVGVKMEHIPFKGASQMIPEVLANRVEVLIGPANSVMPFVKSGQLRALGVTSKKRWDVLPHVPTLVEAGVTDYDVDLWYALLVPSRTPGPVIDKLNKELNTYLKDPATKARFDAQALTPTPTAPEAVNELIKSDVKRWRAVAQQINLQLN